VNFLHLLVNLVYNSFTYLKIHIKVCMLYTLTARDKKILLSANIYKRFYQLKKKKLNKPSNEDKNLISIIAQHYKITKLTKNK